MANPTSVGFFGKLPSAGDFVQRRLPSSFVEVWDRHFEHAVAESRSSLGSGWQQAYQASPVWRFVLAPGICGASGWAGVMGPGLDRVGRCFPMVIATELTAEPGACSAMLASAGWFAAAERVLADAQARPETSVDGFDSQVAGLSGLLGSPITDPFETLHAANWRIASHWRLPLPAADALATAYLAQLWSQMAAAAAGWCLWWTQGAGLVPASVLATAGLPQPQAYAAFLDAGQAMPPWQSLGTFDAVEGLTQPGRAAPVAVSVAAPASDDLSALFAEEAEGSPRGMPVPAALATAAPTAAPAGFAAFAAVLHRHDCALTLVAADSGDRDPGQQAAEAVFAATRELTTADLADGLLTLRTRVLALHAQLRHSGDDLVNPVAADCAVIAARLVDRQLALLRIGAAAAWRWRDQQLLPLFAESESPDAAAGGDLDDLLFCPLPTAAGLGAAAQPSCDEAICAVEPGDRLLLAATRRLMQLSPEMLARGLAMPSCEEARARIAAAAGLGADQQSWPFTVIEAESC